MAELLKFRKRNVTPPGGYAFQDPDSEHVIVAGTFDQLVQQVKQHRKANDFEVPDNISDIIEDWICQRIPLDMTSAWNSGRDPLAGKRMLSSTVITKATTDYLHYWRRIGRKFVPVSIANNRGLICSECKSNTNHTACMSCQGTIRWAKDWIRRDTVHDKTLYVCNKCAVLNVVQVHMTTDVIKGLTKETQLAKYPDTCWKKRLLQGVDNAET